MKIKSYEMLILFDFYGNMLTDKQRELFDLYYSEDMSLAEISENTGITRQAVRDTIVRVEKILGDTESKLGLAGKYGFLQPQLEKISDNLNEILKINETSYRNPDIAALAEKSIAIVNNISSNENPEVNDGV